MGRNCSKGTKELIPHKKDDDDRERFAVTSIKQESDWNVEHTDHREAREDSMSPTRYNRNTFGDPSPSKCSPLSAVYPTNRTVNCGEVPIKCPTPKQEQKAAA